MSNPEIKHVEIKPQGTIAVVGGARPNFMKIAPLVNALKFTSADFFVVNTGQHYSPEMAGDFFKEFNFVPNINLTPPRANDEQRNSYIYEHLKEVFQQMRPRVVVVVGDVDSTLLAAHAAHDIGIQVAHVEAGLRSRNPQMKEEFNRIETDKISSFLFAPSKDAAGNLKQENADGKIFNVGNIMIDALHFYSEQSEMKDGNLPDEKFYFVTLHRAENVDNKKVFSQILDAFKEIKKDADQNGVKIYLTLHPRTYKMATQFGFKAELDGKIFILLPPLTYKESIYMQKNALLVLTDSGGVQEESSVLGTPCLTLRNETERPITIDDNTEKTGTNKIAGISTESILAAYMQTKTRGFAKKKTSIDGWDGRTAERIVRILRQI